MATNLTSLTFDEGANVEIYRPGSSTPYQATALDTREEGAMFEYLDHNGAKHRIFRPWHSISSISQEV